MGGLCDESNRRNNITMLLFFGAAVPVSLYIMTQGGVAAIEPGLVSGLVVGGIASGLYFGYKCNFNLGKCLGNGVESTGCGLWTDLKGLVGQS